MAAELALKSLEKQVITKAAEKSNTDVAQTGTGQSFQDVLKDVGSTGKDMMNLLDMSPNSFSTNNRMEVISAQGVDFQPSSQVTGVSESQPSDMMSHFLNQVNDGQMQMDNMVNHIMYSNQRFSSQELLVMQAQIYNFSQMTELTVKVADQGVSAVRTVLNTQVQ